MDSYQQQLYDSTDILLINENAANTNNTSPSSKNSWDNIQGDSQNSMDNNDQDEYFTWNSLKIDESNLEDGSHSANVVIDQGLNNSNNSGANNGQSQNQKVPMIGSRKRKLLPPGTNDGNIPLQNKTLRHVATNNSYKLQHQEALNNSGNIGDHQQSGLGKHGAQLMTRKTGVQGGAVKMPQWHVDDIGELEGDIDSSLSLDSDLANNGYNVSDSILSISGLQVFKQEVPSPTNHDGAAPSHAHNLQQIMARQQQQQQQQNRLQQQSPTSTQQNPHHNQQQQQMSMSINNLNHNQSGLCQNNAGAPTTSALDDSVANSQQNLMINNTISQLLNQSTAYTNLQNALDSAAANLVTTTGSAVQNVTSQQQQDNYSGVSSTNYVFTEDCRFQYVLAAATSIATKVNEDTLTYLNQGQSYEIKLKKLGDLSMYRGKLLKSVVRICFHERRLQFMEREQMALWQRARPGDRILEVDVPLSYGAFDIVQPANALNLVHFNWDPTKEVGVYIKVNCISTEFTPKKHGGEKGVPFRIQVETYQNGENFHVTSTMSTYMRLHAAACQIKVFKLKGADRKHKQDREKIMKRPMSEQEKYQPSYECTVLNDIPNEAVLNSAPVRPISPAERGTPPKPLHQQLLSQFNNSPTPINRNITTDNNEAVASEIEKVAPILSNNAIGRVESPNCSPSSSGGGSPGNAVERKPDPGTTDYVDDRQLSSYLTPEQTSAWLLKNRFEKYARVFENFSGSDMLRMSRDDLIQICGHADGIRLFNSIHMKSIMPKLKLYVSRSDKLSLFNVIYLSAHSKTELKEKLGHLVNLSPEQVHDIYMEGPKAIHVQLTDDVISHLKDESMFTLDVLQEGNVRILLLKLLTSSSSSSGRQ